MVYKEMNRVPLPRMREFPKNKQRLLSKYPLYSYEVLKKHFYILVLNWGSYIETQMAPRLELI
jgi:hypothetical protein